MNKTTLIALSIMLAANAIIAQTNPCEPSYGWDPAPSLGDISAQSIDPFCVDDKLNYTPDWGDANDQDGTCVDSNGCGGGDETGSLALVYQWEIQKNGTYVDSGFGKTVDFSPLTTGLYELILTKSGSASTAHCTWDDEVTTTIYFEVWDFSIISVDFTSDHDLMLDNDSDYTSTGNPIPDPEYTGTTSYPISHTMSQSINLDLTLDTPNNLGPASSALVTVTGDGATGLDFSATTVVSANDDTVSLTATQPLPSTIQELTSQITWEVTLNNHLCMLQTSGAHTVFVTLGTPRDHENYPHEVTIHRMDRAIAEAAAVGSTDPHTLVAGIIEAQGAYDPSGFKANPWHVPDSPSDCTSIIAYAEAVARMIDIPGTFDHKNIYALDTAPTDAILVDPTHGGLAEDPNAVHSTNDWELRLIDSNSLCNAFESVGKFTHDQITKYYAGGTTPLGIYDDPDNVLNVFDTLHWVAFVDTDGDGISDDCVLQQQVYDYP